MAVLEIKYAIRSILISDPTVFGLVAARVYPLPLPENKIYPLIGYHRVNSNPLSSHSGSSHFDNGNRIQLDLWTNLESERTTLRSAVKAALHNFRGTVTIGGDSVRIDRIAWSNDVDLDDPEINQRACMVDLMCWHETAN